MQNFNGEFGGVFRIKKDSNLDVKLTPKESTQYEILVPVHEQPAIIIRIIKRRNISVFALHPECLSRYACWRRRVPEGQTKRRIDCRGCFPVPCCTGPPAINLDS